MIDKKQRWGIKPPSGISELLGETKDFMGRRWELYQMFDRPNDAGWMGLKLRLRGKAGGRVNYYLAWNAGMDRFAGGGDYASLRITMPMLFNGMLKILKEKGFVRQDWEKLPPERKQ